MEKEPFYPILNIEELDKIKDHRDEIPLATRQQLDEHDIVVHVVTPEIREPTLKPAALREILRLTNATKPSEIGEHGAAVAALASSENKEVTALRKFEVGHGRDELEIALKLHSRYPKLLKTTILELARTQGQKNEVPTQGQPFRQEEVGRIILLNREPNDLIGKKFSDRQGWGWPFYGSIDATPSFASAIATYDLFHPRDNLLSTIYKDRHGEQHTVQNALDSSLSWIITRLQESKSGLLEYKNTALEGGMLHQAWKDSAFGYAHADGEPANHHDGIASIEVQVRAYDALIDAAELYERHNDTKNSASLRRQADKLRTNVFNNFWINDQEKGSYFAQATDYDKHGAVRPLRVRSSNMGHVLHSRLLEDDSLESQQMRDAVVAQLFSPELLHTYGVRTLASDEIAFRPGGYHTGTVWLWDTAYIADGLERHNYHHLAWNLRERIGRAVNDTRKFPEFVRGDNTLFNPQEIYVWNSKHDILHLFEQPPQEIQGWSVSAILAAKRAYLGYLANRQTLPTNALEQAILQEIAACR